VLRGEESIPAPGPEFRFEVGDVVVATGTNDGLARLRDIMLATP
jgi:K+/H+ antiporter YhaU regulatory subunit KhtT